jgi:serine phosphatase RsbU (regulator of sigma subunit)
VEKLSNSNEDDRMPAQHSLVLVEGDPGDALLVEEMLRDVAPDVIVTTFATLAEALERWPDRVDCVLLDLGLPDALGLSSLRKLRGAVPDTPVVVLTGRIDDSTGAEALAEGAQDFLVKGHVDGAALRRSVRYAVERGRLNVYERQLVASEIRASENARLQRGLLPSPLLKTDLLRTATTYRPGRERALLGGDFYDVVETGAAVQLLIGDVSGHGPDEAALGVALRIAWRSLVLAGLPARDVLLGVEQVLLAERDHDERFATVAMVVLHPEAGTGEVLLAGHPTPFLHLGSKVVELDAEPAPALTMVPGRCCEPGCFALEGEWGLVLYTDGLVEGSAGPGTADRLGSEEMRAHLEDLLRSGTAREDLGPLLVAEAERRQGGPLTDDVAVLVVGTAGWWVAGNPSAVRWASR